MFDAWWFWPALLVAVYLAQRLYMRRVSGQFGVRATEENAASAARLAQAMIAIDGLVARNEFGQAMHLLDEILKDPEIGKVPAIAALAHTNRARIAGSLDRLGVALESARAATGIYRDLYQRRRSAANARGLGEQLSFLGQIQRHLDQVEEATRSFEEVIQVSRHSAFRQTVIRAQIELARLRLAVSDFDEARSHALEAQRLCVKWDILDHRVEAIDAEADIAMARGDHVETRRLLNSAFALIPPDASPILRTWLLATLADVERIEGDASRELSVLFELLRNFCDLKVGRGWRQDQADLVRRTREIEARLFSLGFARSLAGDEDAARVYVAALGMLRESEIAQALRFGILESDDDSGLSQVISSLLGELAQLEDPESGTARRDAATYEKLEAATSARFRQLVELPSRRRANPSSPGNHLVQLRLVEDDDERIVYGSWQNPDLETSTFSHRMTADEFELLSTMTGQTREESTTVARAEVRASASGWSGTAQYAALSGTDLDWHALLPCLLPPPLIEVLRSRDPEAPDCQVPLLLLATDGWLWTFPWSALRMTEHTTLIDHAAIALVPSYSILVQSVSPRADAKGVLAYLHGVNPEGLDIERTAIRAIWGEYSREAATPAELTAALADAGHYTAVTMSVHGDDRAGLAHSLLLDRATRTRLSAARMMSCRFPRTVIVGACFSGDLDKRLGTDPTGIPTVMLCRGANTVIGGVLPLVEGPATDHATARILSRLYEHLAAGTEAPWALRQALRWWKSTRATPPVTWAGLTAISNGSYSTPTTTTD